MSRKDNRSYEPLFTHNPNVIFELNSRGKIINMNTRACVETGFAESDLKHKMATDFIHNQDRERAVRAFYKAIEGESAHSFVRFIDKNKQMLAYSITYIPAAMSGRGTRVYAVAENKTAQKQAEERLEKAAFYDDLTGLPNRGLFEESLQYQMKYAAKYREQLAVVFMDLDQFRMINDTAGHFTGDQLLNQASARIQGLLNSTYMFARFFGDKFSLIIPHLGTKQPVNRLIQRIHQAFTQPFIYKGKEYFLSFTTGVSMFPDDAASPETLLQYADLSLEAAKRNKEPVLYYSSDMENIFSKRLTYENDLRKALEREELMLYYQPQIDVSTGKLTGCEALLRWHHPALGIISPVQFIPLAEELGLIEEIGYWVLEEACRQIKFWQEKTSSSIAVSVNVSVRQFLAKNFTSEVKEIIGESGINPAHLHLEITESAALKDIETSITLVDTLKKAGVKVSLDDFGTGYSALSYLKDFSLDILKIDRSFIQHLKSNSRDGAIVKAIITMCDGLSLTAVAEGVETREQLDLLKSYGCHTAQGFYYSKPLCKTEFEAFMGQMTS